MSGVEVAGIVLGVLPLLIQGIQIYHDGLVPIKIWLKYEGALERIMGGLRAEKIKYKMTCERLLSGLVPDEQLAMLLAEPWGSQWKNPDLLDRLQERLQDAYSVYLEQITAMREVTEELRVKLGLDESGKPVWTGKDRKVFKSEWKKISFSLSMGEHRELLQRLDKNNELLDNLTKTSIEFEPLRQNRNRGSAYKALKLICEHAQSLYDALKVGWSCSCKSAHRANLKLETRSKLMEQERAEKAKGVLFGVLFSLNADDFAWIAEIKPSKKQEINTALCPSLPIRVPNGKGSIKAVLDENINGQPRGFSLSHARSKFSKRVNFSVDTGLSRTTLVGENISLEIRSTEEISIAVAKTVKIYNLCSEFQRAQDTQMHLGFLECNEQQFDVYNVQKQPPQLSVSLEEILIQKSTGFATENTQTSTETGRVELTRMDQLQLAAMLASTLLQLQTTKWLDKNWGKEDIKFYQLENNPLWGQAYVSKGFDTDIGAIGSNTLQLSRNHPIIRNEAIFVLGVILIELSEGRLLSAFETPQDLDMNGQRTFMTEYLIATRLLKRVYEREGTRYGDAVRRCIHCEFDEMNPDFANDSFRKKYFDGVVSPLESVWDDFSRA